MHRALSQFETNIVRVRELGALAFELNAKVPPPDVSDLWRAQIVLVVSALDHFIHELVRLGMIDSSIGKRPKTESFLRFPLPLASVDQLTAGLPHEQWLGDAIRQKHSWLGFQHPDKVAEAVRLISDVRLWDAVALDLGRNAKDVKIQLELVVDRRNKIAHEADMDPVNPGFRWPIDERIAGDVVDFIELVAAAIFRVATS